MSEPIDPRWAWEPYQPSPGSPWDLRKVGHLYRRAAFGATLSEQETALKLGPERTIDRLLAGALGQDDFDRLMSGLAGSIARSNNAVQLPAWWLYRILYSPHPLREKITLFWHNHFATSNAKVQNAAFMLEQYRLMHQDALGNFRTLVQAMSRDPAMMVWLDTAGSRKGNPNENYARELMELFTLGVGNYTERDIREAARAFTGWNIRDGRAHFDPNDHDNGPKTVLGQTGNWQGPDIVRICLEQRSAPYFITRKLYRYLISETEPPADELLHPLADEFRRSDWNIGRLVATMLRSNLFFSSTAYRQRIKSPVEFAVGIVRALEGRIGTTSLTTPLEELGQKLFYPPSVKGWDGGTVWLNGQTLLFRQNLALALISSQDNRFGRRTDPAALVRRHQKTSSEEIVDFLLQLFLQGDVPADTRTSLVRHLEESRKRPVPVYWTEPDGADHRIREVCHLILTVPEFQLS